MDCRETQELLPLFAGGDLAAADESAVAAHCRECVACAAAAERWQTDLALVQAGLASGAAMPEPAALQAAVTAAVAARREPGRSRLRELAAAAAVVLLLGSGLLWRPGGGENEPMVGRPTFAWTELQDFFDDCLTAPVSLAAWQAEPGAGVLAVLVPADDGTGYVVAACVESSDLARLQRYPWLSQRVDDLQAIAGPKADLLVTTCGTGGLDRASRRRLQHEFQAEFGLQSASR